MESYSEDLLDKISDIAVCNLYTKAKENNGIINFYNFSFKKKGHLALLKLAAIAQSIFGFKLKLYTNPFNFIINKIKIKAMKCFEFSFKKKGIDAEDFITHIEGANNSPNIFDEIFIRYYKEG